jgi:mannose-6-phosphate isomerase-like protein (cupin superfamily)
MLGEPRRVEKPWGHEIIWAESELYVGKILHVRAGESLSIQYHEQKDETICVLHGTMKLRVGPAEDKMEEISMGSMDRYHIPPGTVHQMIAVTDCDVLEASTPHLDDVVRLRDRYGRV